MTKIKIHFKKYGIVYFVGFIAIFDTVICNYSQHPRENAFMGGLWTAITISLLIYIIKTKPLLNDLHTANDSLAATNEKQGVLIERMIDDMKIINKNMAEINKQLAEKIYGNNEKTS